MLTFEQFQKSGVFHGEGKKEIGLEGPGWVYADMCFIQFNSQTVSAFLVIENCQWSRSKAELEAILYHDWYVHEITTKEGWMFKSEEARVNFYRLKLDYEEFSQLLQSRQPDVSRLLEKAFDSFEEQCWDAMTSECLEDSWLKAKQAEFENHELAGSLDGLIAVVVANDEVTKN